MSKRDHILFPDREGGEKAKLSEEKLLAYLDGKLSATEQHDIEQWLADEGMESDALEGLYGQTTSETRHTINRLNHHLRKTMLSKRHRRRHVKTDLFSWVAVVIVLLLAVIAYIVIRKIAQ